MRTTRTAGFTLIELSIVLVIIGLVIGGVLVGKDLIAAAETRKAISQIQTLQISVNIFYDKYAALPGDMGNASTMLDASAIDGNANGQIDEDPVSAFEGFNFWHHLFLAGLVAQRFTPVSSSLPPAADSALASSLRGLYYTVAYSTTYGSGYNRNYITLSVDPYPMMDPSNAMNLLIINNLVGGLIPLQARQIDAKIDDGLPLSGKVLPIVTTLPSPAAASCSQPDGSNAYNSTSIKPTCMLDISLQ